MQTWPVKMAQEAWGAATLPGDVYAGRVDPNSEEALSRTLDLAGMVTLGGYGQVPKGAIGSSFSDPLFHGSPRAGLTELTPSVRGPLGPGVYSTPGQISGRYAGEGGSVYTLPQKERDIYRGHGKRTDEEYFGWKDDKQRLLAATEPENQAAVSALLDRMGPADGYPLYARLRSDVYKGDEGAQALFKRAGFEGVSGLVDGPEVLLFNKQPLAPLGARVAQQRPDA
jgi:hypothetical protein